MAEPRLLAATPQLDIEQILLEARHRWLRPAEICEILQNYRKFRISPEPPNKPPSGSLFLFDKKILRYFRKDGHNWRKKKDGKTVKEAHERLKAGSVDVLHCYYAHGEENENFQRRTYWMLEVDFMHIVLVHYLEVKNSKASYIRNRDVEENAHASPMGSPSCSASFTSQSHIPLQVTDGGSPMSAQTSEYEETESDNNQANSRYHSFVEMQQHGNGPVNDIHILDPCAPIPSLSHYDHQRFQATRPESNFYSLGPEDLTRDFDEIGLGLVPGSKTQLGLASWEEVLENFRTGLESAPFDSTVASTQNYTLDNLEQYSLTLEEVCTTDVGLSQVDGASAQGWQPGNIEGGCPATSNLDVEGEVSIEGNHAFASLLKQLSLDVSNTEIGGLKKYDSFSRWMSNELGDVDDLHLKSTSGLCWSSIESESGADGCSLSNQEQLDSCLVSPSISQEQLFSIVEFSPTWAYTGLETKVLITGTFLKSEGDVVKYKWSCMFGEIEVSADILGDGTLCCNSPSHKAGRVPFYITCSNRLACSEVREFEYKEYDTHWMETLDFHSNGLNEMNLYVRLEKLLSMGSDPKPASKVVSEKQQLVNEINSLMVEVDEEWFNMLTPRHDNWLLEKHLKDKLHRWLLFKIAEDGKGPNVLDKEGQGVLHLAAALEYDWAIAPTIAAGVSVNFRDVHGWTALHWAAYCGRERTVATLIGLGANPGALTDPTPKFPSGRTPADLASGNGHKGIAGFLAESSLTRHLFDLTLTDSRNSDLAVVSGVTCIKGLVTQTNVQRVDGDLSLKDSLSAVRNASQAAARIHQVFRVQSFHRKKLTEYGDGKCGMSDERALSRLSIKSAQPGQHDLSVHTAASRIQNKFRGWKGRKEFLIIRQRVVKIQAHVRGHQVRRKLGIVWSIKIVEKAIRWRKRGSGLRCLRSEGMIEGCSLQNQASKEDGYDFLKEGRKQSEVRLEKALARVKSMVQYPEARDQYRRLLNVVTTLQESKERVMHDAEETGDGDFMTELEEIWNDNSSMPVL